MKINRYREIMKIDKLFNLFSFDQNMIYKDLCISVYNSHEIIGVLNLAKICKNLIEVIL